MSKESENNQVTPEDAKASTGQAESTEVGSGESGETTEASAPTITAEELTALLQKLDEATAEISAQKERYLRTVADLENYRKRALREKEEVRKQANCGLLEDLIPALDNFKLGLKSAEEHEGGSVFAEGFKMILAQLESALKQNGLEEINPGNGPFDPNFHESLAHLPHETIVDGHIIEVHRIGYKIHERLLRPAQVVVSSGAPEKTDSTTEESSPQG